MHSADGEHQWRTTSSHHTSEGLVCYELCSCGEWRVLLHSMWPASVLSEGTNRGGELTAFRRAA